MSKANHEKKVLKEFLSVLNATEYISCLIESKSPPKPDLLVKCKNGEEYFELARVLDRNLIKLRLLALKIAPKMVKVDVSNFGLPERDIVRSKLGKNYATDFKPLTLLLYYDKGFLFGGLPPVDLNTYFNNVVEPLIQLNRKFTNVYFFDRNTRVILWRK